MKYWHSVVAGPIVFGLIYFILWSYGSWVSDYGHSISKETLSKDYKMIRNTEDINFDVFSYHRKDCLLGKVIINDQFIYDKRYCNETEDYVEGMNFEEIEILNDKKITDQFGQILIVKDTIKLGKLEISYPNNGALAFTKPRFKIFNGNLYIVYIKDQQIQLSIIKKDINKKLTLIDNVTISYVTSIILGIALQEIDFEVIEDRIIFIGSDLDHVLISSWSVNQNLDKIRFNMIYGENYIWNEGQSKFIKNNSNVFIVFKTGYYFGSTLKEELFFISKYDAKEHRLVGLKSFRDIEIKGYINRESLHIKIDDNEDIYFKSDDGTVYTINYNSLSTVDTLAEFTKKKFLNLFK